MAPSTRFHLPLSLKFLPPFTEQSYLTPPLAVSTPLQILLENSLFSEFYNTFQLFFLRTKHISLFNHNYNLLLLLCIMASVGNTLLSLPPSLCFNSNSNNNNNNQSPPPSLFVSKAPRSKRCRFHSSARSPNRSSVTVSLSTVANSVPVHN